MQGSQTKLSAIRHDNLESATLDQWQEAFYDLYGDIDLTLPLYDIMLQMVADSTRIAEAMRRGSYNEALSAIPKVFSWLCSMTSKVARGQQQYKDIGKDKTLGELIWHKYPGVCAFCAESKCHCPSLHVDTMTLQQREAHMNEVKEKLDAARKQTPPSALNDWVELFENVYGTVNASRSSAQKTFHFLEEIGEVEVELRKADRLNEGLNVMGGKVKIETRGDSTHVKIEWEDEIADVFSWLTAIYLHIKGALDDMVKLIAAFSENAESTQVTPAYAPLKPIYSFAHCVWRQYGNHNENGTGLCCHKCHNTKCTCSMIKQRR